MTSEQIAEIRAWIHSPEQCFGLAEGPAYDWTRGPEVDMLDALNAPLYAEVPPPGDLSEAMVGLLARLPPAPTFLDVAQQWQAEHPVLPVIEVLTQTNSSLRAEPLVWRFHGLDTDGTPIHDWWEEIRLNEQHAALRWERVARRWNYKHRRPGGLDEAGRRYVWMSWLDQMDRRHRP